MVLQRLEWALQARQASLPMRSASGPYESAYTPSSSVQPFGFVCAAPLEVLAMEPVLPGPTRLAFPSAVHQAAMHYADECRALAVDAPLSYSSPASGHVYALPIVVSSVSFDSHRT